MPAGSPRNLPAARSIDAAPSSTPTADRYRQIRWVFQTAPREWDRRWRNSATTALQLEWLAKLELTEIQVLSVRVVCHHPHGTNNDSPGPSVTRTGLADANMGNFSDRKSTRLNSSH